MTEKNFQVLIWDHPPRGHFSVNAFARFCGACPRPRKRATGGTALAGLPVSASEAVKKSLAGHTP